ncbi:MAG: DUF547 domain-containing protein [Desulfobacterales bacterium]
MKKVMIRTGVLYILLAGVIAAPLWAAAAPVDHSIYAALLEKYVQDGVVDYAGFQRAEDRLDRYLEILENTDVKKLSRNERFAFYTNAYNAWTIKLILTEYPDIDSIKDLGGFFTSPWEKEFVRINNDVVTLDHIEHDILRPEFKDPRVHFAINCAAESCPPLRSEPYAGSRLDQQLDDATRSFINDPQENYLKGDKLYVSRIFKWFSEDFEDDIIGFFIEYAEGDFKEKLNARKHELDVKYLDYDWSLND